MKGRDRPCAAARTTKIENALSAVECGVNEEQNKLDMAYFAEHKLRYLRTLQRIAELCPAGGKILNVGSHYLHLSAALRLLQYEVIGIDAAAFSDQPLVTRRAFRYQIANHVVDRIDLGSFLEGSEDTFDCILFTEIMEHITFNPIRFWQRAYVLMKIGSIIYVTTPNSLTPWKILHVLKNIVTLRGVGLSVGEILHTVTYGHHWKEYSRKELHGYYALLSPDFSVEVRSFNLAPRISGNISSAKAVMRGLVHWACSFAPPFRDQLEAVVRLTAKSGFRIAPPDFI